MLQAVNMMSVPVSEMLDLRVMVLDFAEDLLLILTILKKTDRRPAGLRPGLDDAGNVDVDFAPVLLKCADDAAAGFILIESVAFIKHGDKCGSWHDKAYVVRRVEFHSESPLLQMRQPSCGCTWMRCSSKCLV